MHGQHWACSAFKPRSLNLLSHLAFRQKSATSPIGSRKFLTGHLQRWCDPRNPKYEPPSLFPSNPTSPQTPENLVPDYIKGGPTFGDAASSAALASVAYRSAVLNPRVFGTNYTNTASKIRQAVMNGVDNLGVISPLVDPLNWTQEGLLSTEGQAFGLMLLAAWDAWMATQ